jgi:hypothetical protein
VTVDQFKGELDKFLSLVPDEPTLPGESFERHFRDMLETRYICVWDLLETCWGLARDLLENCQRLVGDF